MTDLTEQWKKGELPEGVYYCKTENGIEILRTWGDKYNQLLNNLDEVFMKEMSDCKIISEVPSYEEWQEKIEENIKLKTENKWYSEQLNEAVKKIDKLKEQQKIKADCKTLAKKLRQVKPELRDWLETNYKEYL